MSDGRGVAATTTAVPRQSREQDPHRLGDAPPIGVGGQGGAAAVLDAFRRVEEQLGRLRRREAGAREVELAGRRRGGQDADQEALVLDGGRRRQLAAQAMILVEELLGVLGRAQQIEEPADLGDQHRGQARCRVARTFGGRSGDGEGIGV